ncbi:MAG: leucine-rich repeat domain-containing protein [Saprospiraceae bacterium]
MSSKLKLTLLGLFLLQIGVFTWSYFGKKQKDQQYYETFGKYLDNPNEVKSLDFSGLNLKKLPIDITKFKNLTSLNLSNNRLEKIPFEIYSLSKLKQIDLSYNRIEEVEFENHINIERINLSHNQIEYVDYHPCSVGCLAALQTIDLSHNQLDECPTFNSSSHVDTILLSNNQLNSFYNLHMSLPKTMDYLDVSSNEFEGVDNDLFEFIGFDYDELTTLLNKCTSINLSNNFFEYFPYEIFRSEKVSKITMQNCRYNETDNEFQYFLADNNLTYLDLSNTVGFLDNIPFIELKQLEILKLENTQFDNLSIRLYNLKKLYLKDIIVENSFEVVCPKLKYLEIDYNYISWLPDETLQQIPNLKTIVITNHQPDENLINRLNDFYPNVTIILK